MVTVEVLERFPVFSGLDRQFLERVAEASSQRTCRAQHMCFAEGEKAGKFCLLREGKVSIERRLGQSWLRAEGVDTAVVDTLSAGDVFGWSALVEPGVLTASARCLDDCEIVEIPGGDLMRILDGAKGSESAYLFMKRLVAIIASRLNQTADRLMQQTVEIETFKAM